MLPAADFMVGCPPFPSTKKTHTTTLLANHEHHEAIVELAMQMREETSNAAKTYSSVEGTTQCFDVYCITSYNKLDHYLEIT